MRTAIPQLVVLTVAFASVACDSETSGPGDAGAQLEDWCWHANFPSNCDPRSEVPCAPGMSCTVNVGQHMMAVACSGPPGTGDLGAPCDVASGCKPGMLCDNGVCGKACCSPEDCSAGDRCSVLWGQLGTLGTCSP